MMTTVEADGIRYLDYVNMMQISSQQVVFCGVFAKKSQCFNARATYTATELFPFSREMNHLYFEIVR